MRPEWQEAERAARAALATHAATAVLAVATFEPVAGSLSNFAWHVSAPGQDRFVRYARAGNEQLGADLHAESELLHLVARAGLAPRVVRCDPSARLLVTQWLASAKGDPSAGGCDRTIRQVAAMLCQLHELTPPAGVRVVDFAVQARRLGAALPAEAVRPALAACAEEVLSRLGPVHAQALCHHDVHAQNLVTDRAGRLWLVDWEYAGLGDPVFDLASCASQLELSAARAGLLCDEYVRVGGTAELSRLDLARWAFDYVQWLWYRGLLAAAAPGRDGFEAAQRAERIECDLQMRASGVLRCNNHRFDHND
ncbi:MAG: choline kinase family protein [Steroidobacteraceae bacterium]|nr:phosphotransferase [Pseudomonadota bacterium]MBP6106971.1 phosphotransferase [Steroidobacteraceae bacterium]MBP7012434.1 phosphotransferase [Steroidobacteraceae bacterium]